VLRDVPNRTLRSMFNGEVLGLTDHLQIRTPENLAIWSMELVL
jgi:hypothetical protein